MTNSTALFSQYMDVVNKALVANKDDAYGMVVKAAEKFYDGKEIGVAVYEDEPSKPHDYYTVSFHGGTFHLLERGKDEADSTWKLPQRHMEEVVADPQAFIDHPARMDLDWMKKRVGLNG